MESPPESLLWPPDWQALLELQLWPLSSSLPTPNTVHEPNAELATENTKQTKPLPCRNQNLYIWKSASCPSLFTSTSEDLCLLLLILWCIWSIFLFNACNNLGKIYDSPFYRWGNWGPSGRTATCQDLHVVELAFKFRRTGLQGAGLKPLEQEFLNWGPGTPRIQGALELGWKIKLQFFTSLYLKCGLSFGYEGRWQWPSLSRNGAFITRGDHRHSHSTLQL